MSWTLSTPVALHFGEGLFQRLGEIATGQRIMLVTSAGFTRRGLTARVSDLLGDRLIGVLDQVESNPGLVELDAEVVVLRAQRPDQLIAIGGGSVLDTAKVLTAIIGAPDGWTLACYFAGEKPLRDWPRPSLVAIPTTAGTGSEVTPFATVWDKVASKKLSLAGPALLPTLALLDPELTLDLPEDVSVSTGLDAISQAIESIWSRKSNAVTEAWALQALRLALPTLARIVADPRDIKARRAMMEASLLAGLAISHTRTALAHSMSYPLTAHHGLPHGLACSFTLPAILEFNASAKDFLPAAQALGYASVAALQAGLVDLLRGLDIAGRLRRWVPDLGAMTALVGEMITPGRSDNNIRQADIGDLHAILQRTYALGLA
jgi:alcohol dehydrogenase